MRCQVTILKHHVSTQFLHAKQNHLFKILTHAGEHILEASHYIQGQKTCIQNSNDFKNYIKMSLLLMERATIILEDALEKIEDSSLSDPTLKIG